LADDHFGSKLPASFAQGHTGGEFSCLLPTTSNLVSPQSGHQPNICDNGPDICDNRHLVIVTNIWQKLSSFERKATLIVTDFWQLLSQIFGETVLVSS